jgi:hypothetical protein
MQTLQTLKLETFKNSQTGNTAELLMNEDNICLYYREPGELGLVEAGQDHKGAYWPLFSNGTKNNAKAESITQHDFQAPNLTSWSLPE